jgi:hypothetical protein
LKDTPSIRAKCPICDKISALWDPNNKGIFKAYKSATSNWAFANVMVFDPQSNSLDDTIKMARFTKGQYEALLVYLDNPQWGDLSDWNTGCLIDFIIEEASIPSSDGSAPRTFPKSTLSPQRNNFPLAEAKYAGLLLDLEQKVFSQYIPSKPEELTAAWDNHAQYILGKTSPVQGTKNNSKTSPSVASVKPSTPEEATSALMQTVTEAQASFNGIREVPNKPAGAPECFGQTTNAEGKWIGWDITRSMCQRCPHDMECEILCK